MGITSVTKKGQITIPVDVRRALGITERDRVEVVAEGDRAVIRKSMPAASLRGSVAVSRTQRGVQWKDLQKTAATHRGRRGAK